MSESTENGRRAKLNGLKGRVRVENDKSEIEKNIADIYNFGGRCHSRIKGLKGRVRVENDESEIEKNIADINTFEELCHFKEVVQGHIDRFREFGAADKDIKVLIDGLVKINNKIDRLYPDY